MCPFFPVKMMMHLIPSEELQIRTRLPDLLHGNSVPVFLQYSYSFLQPFSCCQHIQDIPLLFQGINHDISL